MAKKSPRHAAPTGGLHVAVENQDWVAVRGTAADLDRLGRILIGLARSAGPDYENLDAPGPLFQPGSLGLTLYRDGPPAVPDAEPDGVPSAGSGR